MFGAPFGGGHFGSTGVSGNNYEISVSGALSGLSGSVSNAAAFTQALAGSLTGLSGAVTPAANYLIALAGSLTGLSGAISHTWQEFIHQRVRMVGGVVNRTAGRLTGSARVQRNGMIGGGES